jgi:hypothetical protein
LRYTPYLDRIGVTFKDDVPDSVVNILDTALAIAEGTVEWGQWEGKKRKPCPENPVLLAGQPIGQYHCPHCGMMLMASVPHLSPAAPKEQDQLYFMADYEVEYGQPWPPGYEE